jgi:hypothetical protein
VGTNFQNSSYLIPAHPWFGVCWCWRAGKRKSFDEVGMDLGGLGAILQAVQAKAQGLTVRVYDARHVLLTTFEALGTTSLNMLYSLVGQAIAMQGFSILATWTSSSPLLECWPARTNKVPFGRLCIY